MEHLPEDVISAILSCVPTKYVGSCILVCRTWKSLISRRKVEGFLFATASKEQRNAHLYYTDYQELISYDDHQDDPFCFESCTIKINHPPINKKNSRDVMIGSCEGLVCFSVPHDDISDPVYICNPISREYINLPRFYTTKGGYMVSGFGYLGTTNEYKVVRIYYPDKHDYPRDTTLGWVQTYTLGSGSGWRNVGIITHTLWLPGVQANGALHFFDDVDKKIVVFDLADEEFRVLPSPPCFCKAPNMSSYQLQVLRKDLYAVHEQAGVCVDIWSFKQKDKKTRYDVQEMNYESWKWSREFSIPWQSKGQTDYYQPFALTKNDEVLLWLNKSILCCYDQKTETFKKIVHMDKNRRLQTCQALPHMNSLVSLKDLGVRSKLRSPKIVGLGLAERRVMTIADNS